MPTKLEEASREPGQANDAQQNAVERVKDGTRKDDLPIVEQTREQDDKSDNVAVNDVTSPR
jgi:hypothetical protein